MKYTKLVFDIIKVYIKLMFYIRLNYYDKRILRMLDKYLYFLGFKKEWKKRKD